MPPESPRTGTGLGSSRLLKTLAAKPSGSWRLPKLLKGEDPEFAAYLRRIAEDERGKPLPRLPSA